ncbi:MAG: DUF3631 domain-containing protein [Acidobacteria bacterium]|nr:DUF3631 domain-containing protein [Acidobacteriota bacterium]
MLDAKSLPVTADILAEGRRRQNAGEGAAILDEVVWWLRTFVAYPSVEALNAHALWIAHAHAMDCWHSTPRIAFLSPEPGSGKTRALEVTEPLVPNPVQAVNVSPAYLFRKVGEEPAPTILVDEIDTIFGPKAREHEDIRGLLNAGHRKGAVAGRCVVRGKTVETEELPAYSAVAIAGLGNLPDTILSRAVAVQMKRRSPNERVSPYRVRKDRPRGLELGERLSAWVASVADRLESAEPEMPPGVEDRSADVWEPLIAIADAAGGHWPDLARVAAVAFVAAAKESTPSLGVRLLEDIRNVFSKCGYEQIPTANLIASLIEIDESPWGDLRGKPLDSRRLANLLKAYDIKSRSIRLSGGGTPKGYRLEDFHDAWARYLVSLPESPQHPQQATQGNVLLASNVAGAEKVTATTASHPQHEKPINIRTVADVADVADVHGNGQAAPTGTFTALMPCSVCGERCHPGDHGICLLCEKGG